MELDDETLEQLGFNPGKRHDELEAFLDRVRARFRAAQREYEKLPHTRRKRNANARARFTRPAVKTRRYEHLKNWRAKNPDKFKAIEQKHAKSEKRKASRARAWKKYYAKKRDELIKKNRQRRKTK